jgi:galactokinase
VPDRVVAFGPGRVNVVGEHTDYNDGLCLPFALDRGVRVVAERRDGHRLEAVALDEGEEDAFDVRAPEPAAGWRAFVRGVVAELRREGVAVPAARLELAGDVPQGSGLSSSAALSTALAVGLRALTGAGEPGDRRDVARLCSRVEHDWVGAQTGLLDQMAALFGRAGHALRLDCRSLEVRPVPLAPAGWTLAVADSGEAHAHAASGYNERREECAEAARLLGVAALRDATLEQADGLPAPLRGRARHVVQDDVRVDEAATALGRGDVAALGPILDASHASLRDQFAVSTPTVDALADRLRAAGAAGARIMGGGFGGSVLALFPPGTALPEDCLPVAPAGPARVLEAA